MDEARFCQECGQALVPAPERRSAWKRWRERYPRWLIPAIALLSMLCVADVIIVALLLLLPAPQKGTIAAAVGPTPAYSTPTTTPTLLPTSTLTLTPTGVPPTRPTPTPTSTPAGVSQGEVVWSEPVKISNNISGSYIPSMAFDSQGNLHAVWEDWDARFGETGVHYARWDGTSWSPQVDIPGSGYGFTPAMTVDRNDYVHVVWNRILYPEPYGDIYYSRFDGTLWSEPINLSNTGGKCGALNIAVDGQNNLHVVWQQYLISEYHMEHHTHRTTWSEAMGWAKPSLLLETSGSSLLLAVDHSGKLHLLWPSEGSLFDSKLEGAVWSSPVSIYAVQVDPTIAFDSKGRIHIAWVELGPMVNDIVSTITSVHYSVREAGVWSPPVKISTEGYGFPDIAIDSLGRVHLVWQGGYYAQRDGTKWSTPKRIIDGNIPAIAVDSKDNIHALWSVETGDPQKKETKEDLFHMIGTIK